MFAGHKITLISNYFDPLTDGGIGCASKIYNSKQQAAILEQTKSVTEAGLQLIYYAKVPSIIAILLCIPACHLSPVYLTTETTQYAMLPPNTIYALRPPTKLGMDVIGQCLLQ